MLIGGPGHTVEMDETSLKARTKHKVGRRIPDNWIFGGVSLSKKKWFGVFVPNRIKPTLSAIIRKHIKTGK